MAQTALVQEVVTTHDVDVITSLGLVHDKIDRGLTSIPEYQALLAVRKTIEDMSEVLRILGAAVPATLGDGLISSLRSVEDKAHDWLLTVPEYKALLIVRKSIGDVSALFGDAASPAPAVEVATKQEEPSLPVTAVDESPSAIETTLTPPPEDPAEASAPPATTAEAETLPEAPARTELSPTIPHLAPAAPVAGVA
jgi:hypothetical protein